MKFLVFTLVTIFINSFSSASASSEGIKYFKSMGKAFTEIAKITSPAVVFIETEKKQQISGQLPFDPPFKDMDSFPFGDDILKRFFENRIPRNNRQKERTHKISGQGSGFIISKDGYINPVVIIKPVDIGGVNIERVTAYNAKYVVSNKLGKGAKIEII